MNLAESIIAPLHHAYVIEGEREKVFESLKNLLLDSFSIASAGNPDFWYGEFDALSIDDSREIIGMQMRQSSQKSPKVFVIMANTIGHEAQNSLLKTFEEPTTYTHFFIILPKASLLLPTLLSRVELIKVAGDSTPNKVIQGKKFLNASKALRLKMIAPIVEEKDKVLATGLLDELEHLLSLKRSKDGMILPEAVLALKTVLECRQYIFDRSSSIKLILETLALSIPVV